MFKVALTGGIASGKNFVGDFFTLKKVSVFDTDTLAKKIVEPHSFALKKIVNKFGNTILLANQSLDRVALGNIIFSDDSQRQWLDDLLHPLIYQELFRLIEASHADYCIALIPLLYETNQYKRFDSVITIEANEATQIKRLLERNNLNTDQALQRIKSQASEQQRQSIADDIIVNHLNTSEVEIEKQISQLHNKFLRLSALKNG